MIRLQYIIEDVSILSFSLYKILPLVLQYEIESNIFIQIIIHIQTHFTSICQICDSHLYEYLHQFQIDSSQAVEQVLSGAKAEKTKKVDKKSDKKPDKEKSDKKSDKSKKEVCRRPRFFNQCIWCVSLLFVFTMKFRCLVCKTPRWTGSQRGRRVNALYFIVLLV